MLIELENAFTQELLASEQLVMDIVNMISCLSGTQQEIIVFRYVDCMGWDAIARKVHMDKRSCYRLHADALKKLAETKSCH